VTTAVDKPPPKRPSGLQVAARLLLIAVCFLVWGVLYGLTNAYAADPSRTIRLVRPYDVVPGIIQPWTAVVYVFGGLALPLLPFRYNWDWPKLRFVLACYALSAAVAFLCYCLWPVSIARPPFDGPGLGSWLMRQVLSADREANCFPSSHACYAVLGAILVRHGGAGRVVSTLTWLLAAAVCVTTVTTGQHYVLDVAGGVAVAVASYGTVRFVWAACGLASRAKPQAADGGATAAETPCTS
jgi:membrane-associated phospholipid phosphatase